MKIDSAFICDDVRQEANGKLIFIGAYSQDILLQSFPAALNLHTVLCARFEHLDPFNLEVEATIDEKKMVSGKLSATSMFIGFSFLTVPVPLSQIFGPGTLRVRVREGRERWKEVIKVEIKAAIPASASPISNVPLQQS